VPITVTFFSSEPTSVGDTKKPGALSGLLLFTTPAARLAGLVRVVVMRMVVTVMVVILRERRHGDRSHHDDKQRQQLLHGRDYSGDRRRRDPELNLRTTLGKG